MSATLSTALLHVKAADDGGTGVFHAVLSTDRLDRDGERLRAKCFEPLPEHLPVFSDHRHTTEYLVGSGKPYYQGDVLKMAGSFASTDHAQSVRTLTVEGHLGAMSVGFTKGERTRKDGVVWVMKGSLLEASFVGIPANEDARVVAVRGALQAEEELKLRARVAKMVADAEKIATDVDLTPKWPALREWFRDDAAALAAIDDLEHNEQRQQLQLERWKLDLM